MPRCPDCGTEMNGERYCIQCGFDSKTAGSAENRSEVDDETLILNLLEASPEKAAGERVGRIWLMDPSGGEIEQAPELSEDTTVIGRGRDCTIMLPSNTVSRRHAQIRRENDRFYISDLGSTNGTLLNSEPVIGEEVLKDRDEIGIGIYRLIFRYT